VRGWFNASLTIQERHWDAAVGHCGTASKMERQMSMTTAEVLQTMISENGHIAVLRGPTAKYRNHLCVCRADGLSIGTLCRETLNDLVAVNFVKQDGPENENKLSIFKLTDYGKEAAKSPLETYLTAKLISLGYPWPENLEGNSIAWLEAEIAAITPAA
jgi:hypothetical protein